MPNGVSPTLIVMETRNKVYQERVDKTGKVIDRGGEGWEIVRESNACKRCVNMLQKAEETKKQSE
jgi:hypothetical protein